MSKIRRYWGRLTARWGANILTPCFIVIGARRGEHDHPISRGFGGVHGPGAGAQHGGGGLRQVFLGHAERGQETSRTATCCTPRRTGKRRPRSTRRSSPTRTPSTNFPQLATAYFFLGNSYDQLYKPAKQGDATNDAYIQKAIENYRKAADKNTDPAWKKSALQYLSAAYGSDKLNDPVKAEPVYQEIIALEPKEPGNYMALAKLYEDAGRYDDAEAQYNKAKEVKPNDPSVLAGMAGYYNRQGDFPKTIAALEAGRRARAEQPRGLPPRRRLLLGQEPRRLPPLGQREARLHPEGPGDGGQGAQPQPRLHGSDDLQEHPAPPPGQHREGPGRAEAPHRRGRQAAQARSSTPRSASRRARASSQLQLEVCRFADSAEPRSTPRPFSCTAVSKHGRRPRCADTTPRSTSRR